ncbi:hypothetical protein [Microvirga pudoricolor]|uniref:hypothetical protein n=1 Tax=Microvirga pudoricolor TaxID=2778729 RepID=UPI00194F2FD1|nr:hypothetical protein [Microvirga pudoricolor]MBM6593213.1 hypothetical protein [Microvirga pudoricolor]
MSMKHMALILGCIGSAFVLSGAQAADSLKRPLASLSSVQTESTDTDAPFDLNARPAVSAAAKPSLSESLSGTSALTAPRAGRSLVQPKREAAAGSVDESALRFYASQNDAARVSMEIKRLKVLNPSWEPPTNLFDEARDPAMDQKLWDLFGTGRLDEVRAAVDEIRATDPTWQPSAEFVKKFELAELRQQLVAASDAKDSASVLSVAEAHPDMMVCADVDVMWRVAEALVHTNEVDRAQDLYKHILTRCPNPAERLATIQKAAELLPATAIKPLIAVGQRRPGAGREFESVQLDLLRRQVGKLAADPTGEPVIASELRSFETLTTQKKAANDAVLLGWYYYSKKDWPTAQTWFKQAMSWDRIPKAVEGYALALRQQGQLAEAETLSYEWRDADPLIAKLYIEILATALTEPKPAAMDAGRLARTESVIEAAQSVNGSQAMGWYYYNTGAFQKASPWFSKSVAWGANETNVLGLALAANRMKDRALFQKVLAEHGTQYPAVAALKAYDQKPGSKGQGGTRVAKRGGGGGGGNGGGQAGQLAEAAVAQFKDGNYKEALATLDKRAAVSKEDQGLGVLRGWALYQLNQYDKARDQFASMDKKQSSRDTQYGLYYSSAKLDPLNLGD